MTTREVSEQVTCGRRSAYERLERLVDHGRLETKKVGGNGRVWWRPSEKDGSEERVHERGSEARTGQVDCRHDELEIELDEVFERISDGFYALDDDLRFLVLNGHAMDVLGADESAVGEDIRDVVTLTEAFENALFEALETQEPVVLEDYYDPVDRWFHNAVYPSESGLSVYFREITDQKERERKLHRYEKTIETIWDGVATLDEDDRFVMVNEAFCELTGYDREELQGEHVTLVHDEAVNERVKEVTEDVIADEREYASLEFDLETANGERIPVEGRFGPYELEDGSVGRAGVVRDVTERKERERALERRARQQRAVADLGQFALETDDIDELMHEAARQVANVLDNEYCKVLDLDPDEQELLLRQGVGWHEGIVGEATVSAVESDSQAASTLANDHPIVVEDLETETRFSGPELLTTHDVRSGISTIVGPYDDAWGILGTHDTEPREFTDQDVTFVQSVANILAEAIERHRYQRELEALVTDLEKSNERLEASNERLEQFAYAASHDLREPLRMVSSYLQLIDRRYRDAFDEDGEEFLEFAIDGADRMRNMIEGLLAYSRVEAKGKPFEPVDLNDVFEAVREDLQIQIEESNAEITTDELPRVEGDAGQLRQVLQNLLSNALKYNIEEPPRVDVTAERDGGDWIVSVHDDGIGIDPDEQERIFEVFERLHTHEVHQGTGIGLALCQRIVERHDGDIWVESDPGEGSTFAFTLPATDT